MLPTLSKVLERVLHNQIVSHLAKYNLLSAHQSGFRSGYSTQDVLIYVTDKWLKAIDEGKYTGAVFLDLAKAFDTVNHRILCSKLSYYGFRGTSYDFLSNYLSDRQQRVLFNGELSDWETISIGVPQGSILGPLLLLCILMICQLSSKTLFWIYMLMMLSCIVVILICVL